MLLSNESKAESRLASVTVDIICASQTAFQEMNLVLRVKHGDGNVMDFLAAFCTACNHRFNYEFCIIFYQRVLKDNVRPSARKLMLNLKWTIRWDCNPPMKWLNQCTDLDPVEMLEGI